MFVAVFESLFHLRLEGIIRNPYTAMDYVLNASSVIDGLSRQICMDLQHISGESIVNGDVRSLSNLVHILYRCVNKNSKKTRKPHGASNEISLCSSGSISTHDSAFLPIALDGNAILEDPEPDRLRRPEFQSDMFYERTINAAKQSRKLFSLEAKLEAAKTLRSHCRLSDGSSSSNDNDDMVWRRAKLAIQKRRAQASLQRKKEFSPKRINKEQDMLRKVTLLSQDYMHIPCYGFYAQVYTGLLKKMYHTNIADETKACSKVSEMRDEAKDHIKVTCVGHSLLFVLDVTLVMFEQSLQGVFEDRIRLLKGKKSVCCPVSDDFIVAFR